MREMSFESDLSRASTIPSDWYLDPRILAIEQREVFAKTWQLVGHAEQVRLAGDYFTCEVAGEPLVITRGEDGTLRALSNVCRHRAGPVARGSGHRKLFQCGYHGWTYSLNGSLWHAPGFEGVCDFEPGKVALPPFSIDTWGPFLFVRVGSTGPSLNEVLGSIPEETRRLPLERMSLYRKVDYELDCNWKVYVDNYLEGYHIPILHPGLFRELDYNAYRVETSLWHSKQHAPIRATAEDSLYRRNLPEGERPEALYYWVFPNLMLNLYPDNLQTNVILPLGPEKTVTRFEWYVLDPNSPGVAEEFGRSFAFSDQVQKEDITICEAVQRGLRSKTYDRGRYSVAHENGVHHFHELLSQLVRDDRPAES